MKICIVSPFQLQNLRGIESSIEKLSHAFAASGHEVQMLCYDGPLRTSLRSRQSLAHYAIAPNPRYFRDLAGLPYYLYSLAAFKPDIVIIFFSGYGEARAISLLKPWFSFRVVFVVGYPLALAPHQFKNFISSGLIRHVDAIVVKALYMKAETEHFFERGAEYIPNGIDTDYFARQLPARSENAPPFRLVTVAALERRKGFEYVLPLLPWLNERFGDVHYTLVGDGPDRAWLEDFIHAHQLESLVTLAGAVQDVRSYLEAADVFILLAQGEGMPNAYLEALAMGVPCLVSEDPPFPDIAKPPFAIRVNRNNPQAVKDALAALLSDSELRDNLALAARREAVEQYSQDSVTAKYLELFQKLLTAPPAKP